MVRDGKRPVVKVVFYQKVGDDFLDTKGQKFAPHRQKGESEFIIPVMRTDESCVGASTEKLVTRFDILKQSYEAKQADGGMSQLPAQCDNREGVKDGVRVAGAVDARIGGVDVKVGGAYKGD